MSDIFLNFPFDQPAVLGRMAPGLDPGPAATLPGHAVRGDQHGVRVALVAAPGAAEGRLVTVDAGTRARLDFAMAVLGAAPASVALRSGGEERQALAYRFAEAPPDGAPPQSPEALARLGEVLGEVVGHFGRRPVAEVRGLLHGIAIRALGRSRGPTRRSPVALGTGLGSGNVERLERRHAYARYFGIEEHVLRHGRFDGGRSDPLERTVFTSGDAVVVLPYDPRRDSVLLIEQFRAGPWARNDPRPWRLETVAGRCDRAESTEETARREAREEAGIELGRVELIAGFYPSPAIMSEFITAFVGEADLGGAGGVFGLPEEHEDIRAQVVALDAALAAVGSGEIDTAPLMLALMWLQANAGRLRAAWR